MKQDSPIVPAVESISHSSEELLSVPSVKESSMKEVEETLNTSGITPEQRILLEQFPFGYRRYESISKYIYYVNLQAYNDIVKLCRESGLPSYLWDRIKNSFMASYGLSLWNNKIIVQENVKLDAELGYFIKDGLDELTTDYLNILDEDLKEDQNKLLKLLEKYEKLARDEQEKHGVVYEPGDDRDAVGRLRVAEDYESGTRDRILNGKKSKLTKVGGSTSGDSRTDTGETGDVIAVSSEGTVGETGEDNTEDKG